MSVTLIVVLVLTAFVHLITTMSYAMWIVGVRTKKIAISFSLFNLLVIITGASNTIQAPLLAKHVELKILSPGALPDDMTFRLILLAGTVATILGTLLIPTFQRFMVVVVDRFSVYRSVPRLIIRGLSARGIIQFRQSIAIPSLGNLRQLTRVYRFPIKALSVNAIAVAILTVGFLASLHAAFLRPELRVTSSNLAAVFTGLATVLVFLFVDPYLSLLTDDHVTGSIQPGLFRQQILLFAGSRLLGTLLAQLLLIPTGWLIVQIAQVI